MQDRKSMELWRLTGVQLVVVRIFHLIGGDYNVERFIEQSDQ